MKNRKNRLTDSVRTKIAFQIFSTEKTHREIAEDFGLSRQVVTNIGREFKLQRTKSKPGGISCSHGTKRQANIENINYTYDDELVQHRINSSWES